MANWIAEATSRNKGSLRRTLRAKKGKPIAYGTLASAAKSRGKTGRRARLALTLRRLAKH